MLYVLLVCCAVLITGCLGSHISWRESDDVCNAVVGNSLCAQDKVWTTYIHFLIFHKMQNSLKSSMIDYLELRELGVCSEESQVTYRHGLIEENLTSPCHAIFLHDLDQVSAQWTITVHSHFMINITILHASLPYTIDCDQDYITISDESESKLMGAEDDSLHNRTDFLIGPICGNIQHLSVYTKYNKGFIRLEKGSKFDLMQYEISIVYQVHCVGKAFVSRDFCGDFYIYDFQWNLAMYQNGILTYQWYLFSPLWLTKKQRGRKEGHEFLIAFWEIDHVWLGCNTSSYIAVNPGFLLDFQSSHSFPCGTDHEKDYILADHVYTTISLITEVSHLVNMTVDMFVTDIHISAHADFQPGTYYDHTTLKPLHGKSSMKIAVIGDILPEKDHTITFHHFKNNVRYDYSHGTILMPEALAWEYHGDSKHFLETG